MVAAGLIDSHLGVCHLAVVTVLACHCPDEKVTLVALMSHLVPRLYDALVRAPRQKFTF